LSFDGVSVGGMRVMDSVALTDGAVVRIGDTEFTFGVLPHGL